jgi:hypothetical protein
MAAERTELRVSPEMAAGLAEFIDFRWGRRSEALGDSIDSDTGRLLEEMVALLALHDELLEVKEDEAVVSAPHHLLQELLADGGDFACETIGYALKGDFGDDKETAQARIRGCKGLMELARREGMYEGVMV